MINWKANKAAVAGASKYLIKGFFQVIHSATSASVDTTDCIFSLEGPIDDAVTALTGSIDSADTALTGTILETLAVTGQIIEILALTGSIDDGTTALTGAIDDAITALTGTITETLALSSGDLCTI